MRIRRLFVSILFQSSLVFYFTIQTVCGLTDQTVIGLMGVAIEEISGVEMKYVFDMQCDFPSKWPEAVPQIETAISSQSHSQFYNSIFVIRVFSLFYSYSKVSLTQLSVSCRQNSCSCIESTFSSCYLPMGSEYNGRFDLTCVIQSLILCRKMI